MTATGDGKWVFHVYQNPESGSVGCDHAGATESGSPPGRPRWRCSTSTVGAASQWSPQGPERPAGAVDETRGRRAAPRNSRPGGPTGPPHEGVCTPGDRALVPPSGSFAPKKYW